MRQLIANIPTTLSPHPSAQPVVDWIGGPVDPLMLNLLSMDWRAQNHVEIKLGWTPKCAATSIIGVRGK